MQIMYFGYPEFNLFLVYILFLFLFLVKFGDDDDEGNVLLMIVLFIFKKKTEIKTRWIPMQNRAFSMRMMEKSSNKM